MKHFVFTLLLFTLSSSLTCAQYKISEGEGFRATYTKFDVPLLSEGNIYVLKSSGSYSLSRRPEHSYDVLRYKTLIPNERSLENEEAIGSPSLLKLNDHVYVQDTWTHYSGVVVNMYRLDLDKMESTETIPVHDQKYKTGIGRPSSFTKGEVFTAKSPDEKYYAILVQDAKKNDEATHYHVFVYSDDMQKVWEHPFTRESSLESVATSVAVSKDGTVSLSLRETSGKGSYFGIFQLSEKELKEQTRVKPEGTSMTAQRLKYNQKNQLICVSYFFLENYKVAGIRCMIMEDGAILNEYYQPFWESVVKPKGADRPNTDNLAIPNLMMDQIILLPDGGFLIVGETLEIVIRTVTSENRTTTTRLFDKEDILIQRFDPSGDLSWSRRISKNTRSSLLFDLGYSIAVDGKQLNLLFNDHAETLKNRFHTDSEKHFTIRTTLMPVKTATLYHVKLNVENGDFTRTPVVPNFKKSGRYIYSAPSAVFTGSSIKILCRKGYKFRLDEITMN